MSSDPTASSGARQRASVIRTMLTDEYHRVLATIPPRYPGDRHSAQQCARAKGVARRNVLDRLQAAD